MTVVVGGGPSNSLRKTSNPYSSAVLFEGTVMFTDFDEHMMNELTVLAPSTMRLEVSAQPGHYQQMWISKGGCDESGPMVVYGKCS